MECPRCKSSNITQSHRRGFEKVLRYIWAWYVPYRCKECWTRFWVHEKKLASILTAGLIAALLVASVIGGMLWWEKTSDQKITSEAGIESIVTGEEKRSILDQPPLELPDESSVEEKTEGRITEEDLALKPEDEATTEGYSDNAIESPQKTDVDKKTAEEPEPSVVAVKPAFPEKKPEPGSEEISKNSVHQLKGIEATYSHGEFRMSILTDESVQNYKAFALDNPPRLVINLKGKWRNRTKKQQSVESNIIKKIRIGEHPDKKNPYLSIVLDAEPGISLTPKFEESAEGLILILRK